MKRGDVGKIQGVRSMARSCLKRKIVRDHQVGLDYKLVTVS
jgi:hypothetical protein